MNPLAEICKRMGLSNQRVATLAGCRLKAANFALATENVHEYVETFIDICAAMEVQLRLTKAEPLHIWIDCAVIDELYASKKYRSQYGLIQLPPTRREMTRLLLHYRRTMPFNQIIPTLEKSFICTSMGYTEWSAQNLDRDMKKYGGKKGGKRRLGRKNKYNQYTIKPNEESLARWRRFVVSNLMAESCPEDPMLGPRYGIAPRIEGDKMILQSTKPIPTAPRRWFMEGLGRHWWLEPGHWGEVHLQQETGPTSSTTNLP